MFVIGEGVHCHSRSLPIKVQNLQREVCGCTTLIQELSAKVKEQDEELSVMRKEVRLLLSELGQARHDIKDITKELNIELESKKS